MSLERIKNPGEITIIFVNDKGIRKLNFKYRSCNEPTDVLSFDLSANPECSDSGSYHSGKEILSDIVVSTQTAIRNARAFKTTPTYEMYLYVIHGLLHILGYDDKSKKDKLIMQKKEESLLKTLNLSSLIHNP